ncbi:WD40/YVTN/BNR-like repeat-containing protein [Chelativorans salis]|uniref:Exo-alpha-sialidase n=1 Tax=Chelativorans salis TaxID=2978478 RepID=A0ABT2LYN4_9HYPH|nr:exo-alpha-sialidase [Chelativorans sp. EGI FJ00035]MCT7378513.1 exo-alpha-sialidase [Chelativorans sp. EGI FJ00035]
MRIQLKSWIAGAAVASLLVAGVVGLGSQAGERVQLSEVSHIHGIAVDREDPSRLYLATHHGVWHTAADGTAERISDNRNDYMGFTPHPAEAGVFFGSGHPVDGGNMGVIVSRDGGHTWEMMASGANGPVDFHAMDISQADPNVMYGSYGSIQVSRDGGKTWEVAGAPPADVFAIAASAANPDIVYAATRNGLMISRDGGGTWEGAGFEGRPATMVKVGPDGSVYAFVLGTGLVTAPAAALAWQTVADDFGERVLLHLAVDPNEPQRLFAVTDESRILTSTDGGRSWEALAS